MFSCVDICHADAMQKMGTEVTVDEVIKEVMSDAPMYETSGGGVTLSGGECLTQPEFALAILEEARMNGISTCIETCGVCRKDVLVKAANLCDEVFMDLKIMDPEKVNDLSVWTVQAFLKMQQQLQNFHGCTSVFR